MPLRNLSVHFSSSPYLLLLNCTLPWCCRDKCRRNLSPDIIRVLFITLYSSFSMKTNGVEIGFIIRSKDDFSANGTYLRNISSCNWYALLDWLRLFLRPIPVTKFVFLLTLFAFYTRRYTSFHLSTLERGKKIQTTFKSQQRYPRILWPFIHKMSWIFGISAWISSI